VRVGDLKLVAAKGEAWELHDLAADRAETRDLAAREPGTVARLEREWLRVADECRLLAGRQGPDVSAPPTGGAASAAPARRP
jgi:arylsulfatase